MRLAAHARRRRNLDPTVAATDEASQESHGREPARLAECQPSACRVSPKSRSRVSHTHVRRGILGAAALIALGNILSRGLGLVREQVIAASFGASASTDAYVVARTVPLILYDLLVGSVITAAFVPVFAQFARDERQLWRVVSAVFSLASLALVGIAALLMVFAEPLVWVLAGGWSADQRELGIQLTRLALVSVVFQGLAGVLTSVLYARERFALPAFAVATYNAGVIVGVLALAPVFGVRALVLGLIIGALGQLGLQAAGLRSFWRAYRPRVDLQDPAVRRVLALYGPVAAGMLVTIAGYVIDRNLASRLPAGNLSAMQYATTVIQFPLGFVGLATAYAVLPTLSRVSPAGSEESATAYRETLLFGLKLILLLMLPALAALAVLAQPVVAVLFERGAFTPEASALTARVLLAYAPQLPLTAMDYLLITAFYARQDTRTPVLVGVVATGFYLVVALSLVGPLGAVGLALGDAAKNSAHALILLVLLRRALPHLGLRRSLGSFLARSLPAAALTGAVAAVTWPLLASMNTAVALALVVSLGTVVYAALLHLFGVTEVKAVIATIRSRLRH